MNFTARLAGVAAALCLSFGAVAADNGTQPITDQDQCHSCDMWITKYPGPKAEIVTKSGHVYKFCSTKCMTCTLLRLGESDKIAGTKNPYEGYAMPEIVTGKIKAADGVTNLNFRLVKPVRSG